MKKIITITLTILSFVLIDSCTKKDSIPASNLTIIPLDQILTSTEPLYLDHPVLKDLYSAKSFLNIPNNVLEKVDFNEMPVLAKYKGTETTAICYGMFTEGIYKSLVFYHYKGKFSPVIVKSEYRNSMQYFAVTNLSDEPYFDFYTNKDNKLGRFKIHKNFKYKKMKNLVSESPTCMEQTEEFGDCMLCAIDECAEEWECAVTCTVNSAYCLVGFAIGCFIGPINL